MQQKNNLILLDGLRTWGIELSEGQIAQFDRYYELLVEKNKVMNLTAITEYEDVLIKHFLDSLSLVKVISLEKEQKILDLGTGAGFPGIPLKIAFPWLTFTLMDSLNKRILFLQDVIAELGLSGIHAIHARAEEAAKKEEYREAYDLCVSRAVAKLASLSEFCLPFVKQGGYFIPYKSGDIETECTEAGFAIRELGGKLERQVKFLLPNSDAERTLLAIKKIRKTPEKYPRAGGKPLKQPLLSVSER